LRIIRSTDLRPCADLGA